jgi:hypothetical protein
VFQSGKESAGFAGLKWMYDGIEPSILFQSQFFKAGDSNGYFKKRHFSTGNLGNTCHGCSPNCAQEANDQ